MMRLMMTVKKLKMPSFSRSAVYAMVGCSPLFCASIKRIAYPFLDNLACLKKAFLCFPNSNQCLTSRESSSFIWRPKIAPLNCPNLYFMIRSPLDSTILKTLYSFSYSHFLYFVRRVICALFKSSNFGIVSWYSTSLPFRGEISLSVSSSSISKCKQTPL
jgi:hypothetical protein